MEPQIYPRIIAVLTLGVKTRKAHIIAVARVDMKAVVISALVRTYLYEGVISTKKQCTVFKAVLLVPTLLYTACSLFFQKCIRC